MTGYDFHPQARLDAASKPDRKSACSTQEAGCQCRRFPVAMPVLLSIASRAPACSGPQGFPSVSSHAKVPSDEAKPSFFILAKAGFLPRAASIALFKLATCCAEQPFPSSPMHCNTRFPEFDLNEAARAADAARACCPQDSPNQAIVGS